MADTLSLPSGGHGHHVGDQLLVADASRLAEILGPGDTLARFGGDEFVPLCDDLRRPADAELVAARIHEAFTDPFQLADTTVRISASVGLAFAGPADKISKKLLVEADAALYQVKHRGGTSHHVVDLRQPPDPAVRNSQKLDRTPHRKASSDHIDGP